MKKQLPIAILLGLFLALNGLFSACRNGERADFPETAPRASAQQTGSGGNGNMDSPPPPVETKTQEDVVRLLSKTILAKSLPIPGTPLFIPGTGFSKVALARDITSPAPDSELAAAGVLWIDNATGEIVPKPGEAWQPASDAELLKWVLSDFKDDAMKTHLKGMKREIRQVPGLAVVRFLCDPPPIVENGFAITPEFFLQVWVNTRTRTVYCGEVGN